MHHDVHKNLGSTKQNPQCQFARAKALEQAKDWSAAIDAYLAITTKDTDNLDFLEGVRQGTS